MKTQSQRDLKIFSFGDISLSFFGNLFNILRKKSYRMSKIDRFVIFVLAIQFSAFFSKLMAIFLAPEYKTVNNSKVKEVNGKNLRHPISGKSTLSKISLAYIQCWHIHLRSQRGSPNMAVQLGLNFCSVCSLVLLSSSTVSGVDLTSAS